MSDFTAILGRVNEVSGVLGSALLTNDGIMVESLLGTGVSDDVVAGLSSFLISTTQRTLNEAEMGRFQRFVLHSTHGRVVLIDIGEATLVVLTNQFVNLDGCLESIQQCAEELRNAARIHF